MKPINKILKNIYELLDSAVASAVVVLLIFTFVFKVFVVSGNSMDAPNVQGDLVDGERIVVSDVMFKPKRGDIICFYSDYKDEVLVKRVIATEGQTVNIDYNGDVYVDGVKLAEEYITDKYGNTLSTAAIYSGVTMPHTVAKDSVFVLGDNRGDSFDSRYNEIGDVHRNDIFGKLVVRLYPNFGKVK